MLYLKALHIIFVVTWFAGLFYIVRLFIYHTEAQQEEEPKRGILSEQFLIMQKRLWYGITWPSAVITLTTGTYLAYLMGYYTSGWLWTKLAFVLGLFIYHLLCGSIFKKLSAGVFSYTSTQLRIWNEVATLFLVSIVFIVVLKNSLNFLWGLLGLIIFSLILWIAIRIYRTLRNVK